MSGIHQAVATGKTAGTAAPTPDILWWQFTDGSGTTVTATVGPNGTLVGGASWVTGQSGSGYAIQCDGTDDYIVSASNVTFGANVITVCGWVYWDAFHEFDAEIHCRLWQNGQYGSVQNQFECKPSQNGNRPLFGIHGNGDARQEDITQWSAATWTHIAVVYDNSTTAGNITVYINGADASASVITNTKSTSANFATDLVYLFIEGGFSETTAGRIDDFRIYSYGLSAAEVALVYAESY